MDFIEIKNIQRDETLDLIFVTQMSEITFPFPKPIISYISTNGSTFYGFLFDEFNAFLSKISSPSIDERNYIYNIYIDLDNSILIQIDLEEQTFNISFNNISFSSKLNGNIILGLRQFSEDYEIFVSQKYFDGLFTFKNFLKQLQDKNALGSSFNFKSLYEESKYTSFIMYDEYNEDCYNALKDNMEILRRLEQFNL
jgi:hypothetical protein